MSLDLNSSSVEYKGNKVVIKSIPKEGENLSVFMRPGDEVVFEIDGFDPDTLEYILVGGDIVVSFTGEGLLTFPSLGLMGFSSNPPLFSFGGNKSISVDNILSKIEEVNELPITSVDASFKVTTSNKNEDEVPFGSKIDEAAQTQVIVVPQTQSFSDTQSKREDFTKTEQNSATSNFNSNSEPISNSTLVSSTYTNPYSQYTKPNDFDAYKPDVEMIPKPDYEFIPKPDGEMIPKPDEEMIPKPDGEMIPENDFTDYFPENDFDGYGDGDGDGDGPGEGVPSFGFKATAHQVRFSETTNDEGMVEILGGGGSINGYKFDSITNQFEPETIDMSTRSENMVIRAENSTYFNDKPSSVTGINTITFKDLDNGQSVTVDGLTLTADAGKSISASSVATAFASLNAGTDGTGVTVADGSWSGALSTGWNSDPLLLNSVTFTSQAATKNNTLDTLTIESFDSEGVAAPTLVTVLSQNNETTADTYTLTFQNLTDGQSVTVDGLTLTASGGAISAASVATAFASLNAEGTGNAVTNGLWSGALTSNWASGAVVAANSDVTFKSTEENRDISVFETSSAMVAPAALVVASTDGDASTSTTESNVITFQDLLAGQSVTIDGLKLAATESMTGAEVAAVFASITSSSTVDAINTATTNGDVTGTVPTLWVSGVATGADVTFASTTPDENVTDIVTSSSGSSIDVELASSQDKEDAYLSRVLRFEPNMPEGFYVDSFVIDGLPAGITILDRDANEITGSTITKESMIFKDELGKVIEYGSPDFLTSFKSLEFTMKYQSDIVNPFNLSITANYKIDAAYADSVTEPEQSFTNEYTFALKDITSASDYTYNKGEFSGGLDDGFILAKEPNYNIIKDGSGDSIIYGGTVKDIIYDGAGDDKIYLSAGDDLVYGGSGTNYIYGDRDNDSAEAIKYKGEDTVSYELVQSFESSEVKLLKEKGFISSDENQKLSATYETLDENDNAIDNPIDIDMLASYKGVYVDLDGVHIEGLDIDVNGDGEIDALDKINTISKFANRVGKFTYDEDGNAISSTIGENITFTSVTQGAAVDDIVVTSTGVLEVAAPAALGVASIPGVTGTQTQEHTLTFQDLIAGQSVTIDGLKLTAIDNITAAEVAAGFANLAASAANGNPVANGTWSGNLSDAWTSDPTTDATVTFISQTPTAPVADITISSSGTSAVAAPADVEKSAIQGNDLTTEQHNVVFKDLIAGQSVSVGGLTLTASTALSAKEIAAAYANLAAGATTGNSVTGGEWSGTFSSAWTSGAQEQAGLDNLQAAGYDILEDIENIKGSNYSDTIYGNADKDNILHGLKGGDILDGRGGENKLYGGDGYDMLYSGSGNDYIDGGADTDTVNYQNVKGKGDASDTNYASSSLPSHNGGISVTSGYVANGVTVRLDRPDTMTEDYATFINKNSESKTDTLISIEDVVGSNYDDAIFGSSSTNYIEGMGGNDLIFSGGGINFIDGGAGSDKISYDVQDYKNAAGTLQNTNYIDYLNSIDGINVTLGNDFVMIREQNGPNKDRLIDLVKNIEEVSGTKGNDYIRGTNNAEKFWGNDGDDYIRPGGGIDYSWGGAGTDYLELYDDGLVANSKLRFTEDGTVEHSTNTTNGVDGTWTDGYNAHGGINYAYEFEGIGLSNGADTFYGNSLANVINGHNGNDIIYGMGGDDFIRGGNGADTIYGGDGNDTIYGDADDDTIFGGAGDDTIYGYSVYNWSITNRDTIDGGDGNNTLNYSSAGHGGFVLNMSIAADGNGYYDVKFNASTSTSNKTVAGAFDDKIKNFQTIIGSRDGDEIHADNNGMYLDGWSGKDYLYGGTGDDTIIARNQTGEILDGGDGTDTLKLAQSVNFTNANASATNNITVSNFEVLDLGSTNYYARLNINQWDANNFEKIIGGGNTRLFLHSTNAASETFDFKSIDFSEFSGAIYTYGYNGEDTVDLTKVTSIEDVKFYLDGGAHSDTLKIGTETTNQLNVKLLDNYYNTFEKFEVASVSSLEVNARDNNNRHFGNNTSKDFTSVNGEINMTGGDGINYFQFNNGNFNGMTGKINMDGGVGNDRFYLDSSDFTDMTGQINLEGGNGDDIFYLYQDSSDFTDMTGKINMAGGESNDTFYANYEALLDGKLTIDGGSGSDMVDVRTTKTNETLTFDKVDMFKNIERLEFDNISNNNSIELDARLMKDWLSTGTDTLVLDLSSNTQASKVTIKETKGDDMTGFEIGKTYDITLDDNSAFQMQVV